MDLPAAMIEQADVEAAADRAVGAWAIAPGIVIAWVDGEHGGVVSRGLDGDGRAVDAATPFQIGSVTKSFTGLLLADMVGRGELTLDTRLGELHAGLPAPVDGVTLRSLATHTAGLPRMPRTARTLAGTLFFRGNPYGRVDERDVWEGVAGASLGASEVAYSNLGVAALGRGLGERGGMTYERLVDERLLAPMGMNERPARADFDCARDVPRGHNTNHLPAHTWSLGGYAPAGGLCANAAAMLRYLRANMDGSAPGSELAHSVHATEAADETVGLGWFHSQYEERWITWHNGGTGGFRSFMGFDAARRVGVVVMGNSDNSVDRVGASLLGVMRRPRAPERSHAPMLALAALAAWGTAAAAAVGTRFQARITGDRWDGISRLIRTVVVIALVFEVTDVRGWPVAVLGAGVACALTAPLAALWRSRDLAPAPRGALHLTATAVGLALIVWVGLISPRVG